MLALEEYDLSDKQCKARYGALRSTASSYKGELTGSDKHLSFFLEGKPNAEHIHVFESAIDLLSFATLALLAAFLALLCRRAGTLGANRESPKAQIDGIWA